MLNFKSLFRNITLATIGAFVAISAMGDPLLDFAMFAPPETAQRKLPDPVVSWLVKPNASAYCQNVQLKDGYVTRPEGCVFWQMQASRCTIVTSGNTTHSLLGHLFVHCLQTR